MLVGLRVLLLSLLCGGFMLSASAFADAAIGRPNAIDHRVDAILLARLLTQPAASLVDPARQVAAVRLAHWSQLGLGLTLTFQILALAYFWQSGMAARLRDRLRRTTRSEFFVRFGFGSALALIAQLAAFIPGFYRFRVDRVMGLHEQLLREWGVDWVVNTLVAMVVVGTIVAVILWLVERTHHWYIYATAAIFAVSVTAAFVEPYAVAPIFTQAQAQPLGDADGRIRALAVHAGFAQVPIVVETTPHRSHAGDAFVQGLWGSQRIVLTNTLVAGETQNERVFTVAEYLGWIAHGDPLRFALLDALMLVLGAALAVFIADRIGFRRDDDPVSRFALVAALLGCVLIAVIPISNALHRRATGAADRYAVELTGDRGAAVRAVIRDTDQRMDEVCPDLLTRLFLESMPAPAERIAAINGVTNPCR